MEIANVKALSFTYNGADEQVLSSVDLKVGSGELILICGASGSGKSTLLRQLKPCIAPSGKRSGEITLFGKDISELTDREQAERIGFVGQDPESMIVTDTVWHELAFSLESLGADNGTIKRRTAEMAEFFGMTDCFRRSTATLSGGQKQLLSLASAMTTRPELMILDEPSSRLDPIAAGEFFAAVGRIKRELGTAVIVSEHRLEEVLPIADRLIMLDKGRIICDIEPAKITSEIIPEELYFMLPVSVRVWLSCRGEGTCPVSTSEGRNWLLMAPKRTDNIVHEHTDLNDATALRLKDITFRYEKSSPNVLDSLSLEVKKGSSLCILGGNGSGKSTLLSVICGLRKPLSGKIELFANRAAMIPQEPASLFVRDRLWDDLREVCSDEKKLTETVELMELGQLLERHPHDLSGGELQRAAIAKLLLTEPSVILLDEPTKGMDAVFKHRLGVIISELCKNGTTVITVSHDVEFAAEYFDRCAMLFDGELIGLSEPFEFFEENMFYTTGASRMSRGIIKGAVTADDLIKALGYEPRRPVIASGGGGISLPKESLESKKAPKLRLTFGILSVLLFVFSSAGCLGLLKGLFGEGAKLPYVLLAGSVCGMAVSFSDGKRVAHRKRKREKVSGYAVAASSVLLLLIPFTVWFGSTFLNTGKYLFVSLLVMLEASLPFYLMFEGRKPKARELVTVAVLIAAAVAGRSAFFMLPQFKPVLAVVVISGAAFGGQTGFLVGSFSMLISNFMFGQGPWTPWQMFSMGLAGFLAGVVFDKGLLPQRRETMALFGFFAAVVVYGGIVNPSTLFIMHNELSRESVTSAYAAGLPLDLIHGAATLGFLYFLAPSVLKKLERLRVKYGFFE